MEFIDNADRYFEEDERSLERTEKKEKKENGTEEQDNR